MLPHGIVIGSTIRCALRGRSSLDFSDPKRVLNIDVRVEVQPGTPSHSSDLTATPTPRDQSPLSDTMVPPADRHKRVSRTEAHLRTLYRISWDEEPYVGHMACVTTIDSRSSVQIGRRKPQKLHFTIIVTQSKKTSIVPRRLVHCIDVSLVVLRIGPHSYHRPAQHARPVLLPSSISEPVGHAQLRSKMSPTC